MVYWQKFTHKTTAKHDNFSKFNQKYKL